MYSTRMISASILFATVLSFTAIAAEESAAPQVVGKPATVQYPFVAKVTANDVYVRSGKGTAYYYCGKVNFDDTLIVAEESFGWAKVVPPRGSYSWIHKDYIDIQESNPTIGELKGDNVRVWAGSDYIEATRSSSMQTKLSIGDNVELLTDQPETGDYYKIKPPASAYLWVSSKFLKYAGPVEQKKPADVPLPPKKLLPSKMPPSNETVPPSFKNVDANTTAPAEATNTAAGKEPTGDAGKPEVPQPGTDDSEAIKQCHALGEKIDRERQKPPNEQNYTDLRKSVEAIQANTTEEKAAAYAEILLGQIKRYELAISVTETLKKQDESLAQAKERIEKAHKAKLEKLPKESGFIYSGLLKVSHVYTQKNGQKRYLVQGSDGKILCYVIAASEEVNKQLESLTGKKVGIQGTVSGSKKTPVTLITANTVQALP